MAEFCKQCADEMGFNPENNIPYDFEVPEETDDSICFAVLCEGCGITAVDRFGVCLGNCYEGHNNTPKRTESD